MKLTKEQVAEIKALFPRTVMVTQDMIEEADIKDTKGCIGALALKTFVPKEYHQYLEWGNSIGNVVGVRLKTELWDEREEEYYPHYLMGIKRPQFVTFSIRDK